MKRDVKLFFLVLFSNIFGAYDFSQGQSPMISLVGSDVNNFNNVCDLNGNGIDAMLEVNPADPNSYYQWYYYANNPGPVIIAGFGFTDVSLFGGTGYYYCTVTDPLGITFTTNTIFVSIADTINTFNPFYLSHIQSNNCGSSVLVVDNQIYSAYQWQLNGVNIPGATLAQYTATTNGNYRCKLYNSCGFSYSSTNQVVIAQTFAKPVITSSSGSFISCNGQSITTSVPVVPSCDYYWYAGVGNGPISGDTNVYVSVNSMNNLRVVQSNACKTDTSLFVNVVITQVPPLNPQITPANPPPTCDAFIAMSAPYGAYLYQWKKNGTVISGADSYLYSTKTSGNYSCVLSNACGVTSVSNTVPLTVWPLPPATITSANPPIIISGDSVQLQGSGGTGYTYSWKRNETVMAAVSKKIWVKTYADYKVTITDANGCSATSAPFPVIVNPTKYAANLILQPDSSGKDATIYDRGLTSNYGNYPTIFVGGFSYGPTYFHSRGFLQFDLSQLPAGVVLNAAKLSLYTDTYGHDLYTPTIANDTLLIQRVTAAWQESLITWNLQPAISTTHQSAVTLFADDTRDYPNLEVKPIVQDMVANPAQSNGFCLRLSNENINARFNFNSSDFSDPSHRPRLVITYTPPCPATVSIQLTGSTTPCQGDSVKLSAPFFPGYTYQWKRNGTIVSGITTNSFYAKVGGSYTVIMTTSCGVLTSVSLNISFQSSPSATLIAQSATSFCTGGNVVLTANTGAGFSYAWTRNGLTVANATSSNYTATTGGLYKVIVTNAGGCSKLSSGIQITTFAKPSASITAAGPLTFCLGDSVVLNGNSGTGYSYQWRKNGSTINGATLISYTAKTAGSYSLRVTNSNGCTNTSAPSNITVPCRIENSSTEQNFNVYPNPSTSEFTIQSTYDGYIVICNSLGQEVFSGWLNSNSELKTGGSWPNGVYIISLNGYRQKLIKTE